VSKEATEKAEEFTTNPENAEVLALTPASVTVDDKEAIEAALAAYAALSDEAKSLLATEKAKLDALLTKIADLEAAANADPTDVQAANAFRTDHSAVLAKTTANVAIGDKAAVNNALTAYNALSAAVKDLLHSEKALLDSLVAKISELETAATNQQAADSFKSAHNAALALTVGNVATTNKAIVEAALTAYGSLTDAVKALLTSEKALLDTLKVKIADLEAAVNANPADVQAANAFRTDHSAVLAKTTANVAIGDKAAVNNALTAYNTLSAAVKDLLHSEKALLDSLAAKISELETAAAEAAANQTAADSFKTTHATALALTVETVTTGNKDIVQTALTAYNGLSAAVKALLPADTGTKLQALLDKIGQLETPADNQQAATGFTSAHTAALALTVENVAIANKDAVQAALTAYNGLDAAVKALLPADTGTKLQALLDKIGQLETAAASGTSSITLSFNDRGAGAFSQNSFTLSKSSDEPETIALLGEWDSQKWVVDGKEKGTGASLEVKAADYSIGKHSLTVTVVKGDVPWSKTLTFTVGE
jgi:BMFP domain-containing protein YqiC